jgi:hypothetical protein
MGVLCEECHTKLQTMVIVMSLEDFQMQFIRQAANSSYLLAPIHFP